MLVLWMLVVMSGAWWALQAVMSGISMRAVPRLAALPAEALASWPTVSVVVPARDEGLHLEAALEAKRSEGYPALEVVVVDDRSQDDTGAIADALAARDSRVRAVHVTEVPEGWLGKVNALARGLDAASGEWVLFSDADVHLAPGTLARLVAWAERSGVDHVALVPSLRSRGPLVAPALATFFRLFSLLPLWKVPDPRSSAAIGAGAFNLFRRRALDASPGLEWLKMEIADDMALGVMLKRAGARQAVVVGGDGAWLDFYPSFRAMARALEKNGAAAPMPLMLLGVAALVVLEAGYLAALAIATPWAWAVGATVAALACVTQWGASRWLSLPRWPALVPWLGVVPLTLAMARSAVLAALRGGVVWRSTFYSTATVRAGQRLGMGRELAR